MFAGKFVTAVVSAAGRGERMGYDKNKVLIELRGVPVLERTLSQLAQVEEIDHFVIVLRPEEEEEVRTRIASKIFESNRYSIAHGGETREASTRNGLLKMPDETDVVIYHDAARPFVDPHVCIDALRRLEEGDVDGVIACVPAVDTIKVVRENGIVEMTPKRSLLYNVQTPQVFEKDVLLAAHENARQEGIQTTDDSQMVELSGGKIAIVKGSYKNFKITTPEDLILAEMFLDQIEAKEKEKAR